MFFLQPFLSFLAFAFFLERLSKSLPYAHIVRSSQDSEEPIRCNVALHQKLLTFWYTYSFPRSSHLRYTSGEGTSFHMKEAERG
jgi:hypothetical protein